MASSMPRLISTSTDQTVRTGRRHAPLTMSLHPSRCVAVKALHCSASSLPAHDSFTALPFFPLSQPVPRSLDKPAPPQPKWNLFQRAAAAMLDSLEEKVIENVLERGHRLPCTSDPSVQIAGNFSPVSEQPPCHKLSVDGCIPPSINGAYLRNGANPLFKPVAGHHLFDGDGMIHAVRLCNGRASYACRLTETERLRQERALGRAIFPKAIGELHGHSGIARLLLFYARSIFHLVDTSKGIGVANAGITYFNNHFLVMSEDDLPYHIRMTSTGDVDTVGRYDFDGQLKCSMIAHPKIDPQTRELFTLSYDVVKKPFLKYFWFSSSGKKSPDVEIPLPQPTMVHDFAITKNFVVVPDQQIVFKLQEMLRGGSPVVYDETKVCRFGLLPKYATGASEMRWVDVPDCFCFHLWNAWEEENEEVVVIGSCMTPPDSIFNESEKSLQSELTEIRFNLRLCQSTRRAVLGPKEAKMNLEAGMVNRNLLGRKTRFAYLAITEPWPKVSGFAKVDLVTGDVKRFDYGEWRYGGEPYFVPKVGGSNDGSDTSLEDDGHLLAFVHDELTERSELIVVNGVDMTQEAVVRLPSRVPYGFHGTFVNAEELKMQV